MQQTAMRMSMVPWFAIVRHDERTEQATPLVRSHLELLQALDYEETRPAAPDVALLRGPWHLIHEGRWGESSWIDPWGERWRKAETSVGRAMLGVDSVLKSNGWLRPPLWPHAELANLCGGSFIADLQRVAQLHRLIPAKRDRNVALGLLTRAESRLWDALRWELARGVGIADGSNPFQPLLRLYEFGFFPMGWVGNRYDLYVPQLSPAEQAGFAEGLEKRGTDFLSWAD